MLDVCARQLALLEDAPAETLDLNMKLGRVYGDVLDREPAAIEAYRNVLAIEPHHSDALWALRELYDRTGAAEELAEVNQILLANMDDEDPRSEALYRQLARTYQEAREQPQPAIDAWSKVLSYSSHDAEAIDHLEELYTQTEAWADCVDILERKAQNTEDPYERASILFRVAEMCTEQLEDRAGSRRAYAAILEVQPDNLDAYEQLITAYEEDEEWEPLVGLLLNRLEYTDDSFEQVEIYGRTAELFEHQLEQKESAFLVLSQAFETTLDDERFGQELARLASEGNFWNPLIETYQNVIQKMGTTVDSVPMRLRVASWWDEKLDQAEHAATHYQNVLGIEPDNLEALTALEGLLIRYESWGDAVDILQRKVEPTSTRMSASGRMRRWPILWNVIWTVVMMPLRPIVRRCSSTCPTKTS